MSIRDVARSSISGIRWPSVAASAVLWLCFPLAIGFIDSNSSRTADGWASFRRSLPLYVLVTGGPFFVVSAVMHRLYASEVCRLRGWRFWVYPFKYLPIATTFYFVPWALMNLFDTHHASRLLSIVGVANLAWYWLVMVVVVLTTTLWVSYPLAIINQLLIRRFYRKLDC
jgi:hypothetical protein